MASLDLKGKQDGQVKEDLWVFQAILDHKGLLGNGDHKDKQDGLVNEVLLEHLVL